MATDPNDSNWRLRAACKGSNGELFYPKSALIKESKEVRQRREELAKRVCLRCEVRLCCLDWAMRNGEVVGVWGGKTERERRAMLKGSKKGVIFQVG
ncbi:WhiB family transcriptional regulator, redox-sensing transcriptional regulator [Ferrithrix thermotolerans DSM 19514]|uniref:Transcriptional regulator WhiB n=1 Tax=Ferrithrix thermotolerans DSM 19514 TaxID=1121881 RepID=A0A1M4TE65_9ACTN|nr:WhiB family transcriptional regulator [Ferrithrix thermotolerans]SHE42839.1 WhiB family transcriptional regulator, redox-sensing transcriptional regulator [Ferrithrix thermotolerans DSM 19514]